MFDRNQKKFNAQLAAGVGLFTGTVLIAVNIVNLNPEPVFLRQVQYSTVLPTKGLTQELMNFMLIFLCY